MKHSRPIPETRSGTRSASALSICANVSPSMRYSPQVHVPRPLHRIDAPLSVIASYHSPSLCNIAT
jgi:hypothetical protein